MLFQGTLVVQAAPAYLSPPLGNENWLGLPATVSLCRFVRNVKNDLRANRLKAFFLVLSLNVGKSLLAAFVQMAVLSQ